MHKIELLAPAGNRESLVGAINAGANAIYLAGKKFGARAFADNFDLDGIREAIYFAHLRNARVFVTLNTVVFDDEIDELISYTDELVKAHVDGLIVQDLGVLDIFINRYPNTEIHASTQMNTLNLSQVKFLKSLGVKRVILARETSIDTIREIKKNVDIEIEVFVHGALCVSYSGNCLFSSMIGGRSGNRGECAQPCRLPYSLLKDDEVVDSETYLMSTKDLMTIERLDELIDAGVDSFKIEGRMRKPEYVTQTVISYRKAIDSSLNNQTININEEISKLKRVFNREYTDGYIFNIKPKTINNSHRPNHMGIEIGRVTDFNNGKVTVELTESLQVGDGIRFVGNKDFGLGVSRILSKGISIKRAFGSEVIQIDSPERIEIGAVVYKTLDSNLEAELSEFFNENYKCIIIKGKISALTHEALSIEVEDNNNHHWIIKSSYIIVPANNKPTSKEEIHSQFSKLGNTPFEWGELQVETDNLGFIPVKIMNELRREVLELIAQEYTKRELVSINNDEVKLANEIQSETPKLISYVRTIEQYEASKKAKLDIIYVDEDLFVKNREYFSDEVVIKKRRIWRNTDNYDIHSRFVISDVGHLNNSDQKREFIADEFFNVTNVFAANFLFKNGVKKVTLSPELTKNRLDLFPKNFFLKFNKDPNLEKNVYGHEELMLSRYCPIAKTFDLNVGCNLCTKNQYALKDSLNNRYALINDGLCNIKVLHSKPLVLIDYVKSIISSGVNTLRLNFSTEDFDTTYNVIMNYLKAMNNEVYYLSRENVTTGRFLR